MKFIHYAALLGLVAAAGADAQSMSTSKDMPKAKSVTPAATTGTHSAMPTVDGIIQKLDAEKGLIVLKHGDIPNLGMPAMTMGFDIDKKKLKGFKVGEKVKFKAEMVNSKATVTELRPAR